MSLRKEMLGNGMRVMLVPFDGTEATSVFVLTRVGSRYEYPEINGASHYIEHLMFKGTKRRPDTLTLSRALDAVGAEFNAYTGKDITAYYIKAAAKHAELAVDMLHDMLFHSVYDKKEMDRERGVIIEEINMYRDNPLMHVEDLLEQAMFDGTTLGWEIAGSHETMRGMTRDQVIDFRDQWYVPENMVVVVSGKIDRRMMGWIEKRFGKVRAGSVPEMRYEPFHGIDKGAKPRVRVQYKDTSQMQLALGFPGVAMDDDRRAAMRMLATILGGSMSSRLFISVRERKGLAYLVRASHSSYEDAGVLMIQAGLDKSRLPLAVRTIKAELRKIIREGVDAKELREAKDYIRGKTLLQLEDSAARAEFYGKQELYLGKARSPQAMMREIDAVTPSQVKMAAKETLDLSRLSVAAIGPYKTATSFLRAAGI